MQFRSRRVFAKDAVILNTFDSGGPGAGYGFFVNHIILQPQVSDAKADNIVDDCWDVLGGAESVDEVNPLPGVGNDGGLSGIEVGVALQAQHFS